MYFNDVDLADWPNLIKNPDLKWNEVKEKLEKKVLLFISNNLEE
jgi:hypothetical protein